MANQRLFGVVCSVEDIGGGRVRLTFDDASCSDPGADRRSWRMEHHFTAREFSKREFTEGTVAEGILADIGLNLVLRLAALEDGTEE